MKFPRKIPLRVIIGLLAAIVLDTAVQLFWKSAVLALPGDNAPVASFLAIFREPLFIAVVFVMGMQFFNWMAVLNRADLSFAQPITALSYVSVGLLSAFYFGEPVDSIQVLGIACVLAGVWFISRSDHSTASTADQTALAEPASAGR